MPIKKNYDSHFKFKVVLESLRPDVTQEMVMKKFGIPRSVLNKWRKIFKDNGNRVFEFSTDKKQDKAGPHQDPEKLIQMIGQLTVENELLKKAMIYSS